MKVRFFSLNLLLTLGLAGCGSQAPEQTPANNGKATAVVLTPTAEPEPPATGGTSSTSSQNPADSTPTPEPVAEVTPEPVLAAESVAVVTPKPTPVVEPAPTPEPEETTPERDLFRSAGSGDVDAVKYHLAHGARVNAQDKTGKTALLWAVRSQRHAVVSHLLARGANPNLADNSEVTPLFWAVRMRRNELVAQLLSKGADIGHKDKRGRTALDYSKDETVTAILRRHADEKK
ncbi:MAG: hypothetical protein HOJ65_00550 [Verrucomicrobia bacterium]|nr:hypothetical protein [Verrucomicrobiota bacterium]MBT5619230.1 hypothetical protein [Verrucomicrobiota bacterium]